MKDWLLVDVHRTSVGVSRAEQDGRFELEKYTAIFLLRYTV